MPRIDGAHTELQFNVVELRRSSSSADTTRKWKVCFVGTEDVVATCFEFKHAQRIVDLLNAYDLESGTMLDK